MSQELFLQVETNLLPAFYSVWMSSQLSQGQHSFLKSCRRGLIAFSATILP